MTKRCMSSLFVLTATVSGCTQLSPELEVVHDAAEVLGGWRLSGARRRSSWRAADRITGSVRTGLLTRRCQRRRWSRTRSEVDLQNHRARVEVVSANFAGNMGTTVRALDGRVAFDVGGSGNAQRVGSSGASERRAEYYHHPLILLQAALAEDGMAATVSNLRQESGQNVVDITTADGSQLTLHIDAQTRLPLLIESTSYNTNLGDVTITTTFADYTDAGGFMLPQERSQTIDGRPRSASCA